MATDPTSPEFDYEALLKTDVYVSWHSTLKHFRSIFRTTGSLSAIASICIIVHILRSHHGLSTTYHRLFFGLCLGDVLFSFFGFILGGIMAPKELGYTVLGAMGNQASCDAQGFLYSFGSLLTLFYNSNICIYYFSIVTFNKKDDFIRNKLEPWLHGISILFSLAFVSAVLAINGFNSSGANCWFAKNSEGLPHCMGLESGEIQDGFSIPCGRGDGKEHPTFYRFLRTLMFVCIILTLVVIVVTMALMYRTVYKVEKKMQKYGAGALRLRKKASNIPLGNNTNRDATSATNNNPSGSSSPAPHNEGSGNNSRFSLIQLLKTSLSKIPCINTCCSGEHGKSRSNSITSQKRAILHRALGYVIAWALSWLPMLLPYFFGVTDPLAVWYFLTIFHPLQGVFNLIAYLFPKVKNAKKGPTTRKSRVKQGGAGKGSNQVNPVTWRQAFIKACTSRGPKRTSGQYNPRTNSSSINSISWRNTLSDVLKKLKSSATSTISALSGNRASKNSTNDGKIVVSTTGQQQQDQTRPPSSSVQEENIIGILDSPPPPARYGKDDESPETPPTLQSNSYDQSPPLVLAENADDLKGEGEDDDSKAYHLGKINDTESMSNDFGEIPDDVFLSEEIQSILE